MSACIPESAVVTWFSLFHPKVSDKYSTSCGLVSGLCITVSGVGLELFCILEMGYFWLFSPHILWEVSLPHIEPINHAPASHLNKVKKNHDKNKS